jgi:hypothetical protein
MKTKTIAVFLLAGMAAGCGSEYTIIDRSRIVVSDNTRTASRDLIPGAQKHPQVVEHLAVAQEVYEKQFNLLKERRNKVRARRRTFELSSFITMALSALGSGGFALASIDSTNPKTDLKTIGAISLLGMGLGTGLQIGGLMQEEAGSADDKIRHLQAIYNAMMENLRNMAVGPDSEQTETRMGAVIESFINDALQINVKG